MVDVKVHNRARIERRYRYDGAGLSSARRAALEKAQRISILIGSGLAEGAFGDLRSQVEGKR